MKFWLILLAIFGFVGWTVYKFVAPVREDRSGNKVSLVESLLPKAPSANAAPVPAPMSIVPGELGQPITQPDSDLVALGAEKVPGVVATYTFRHRELPVGLDQAGSIMNLKVISDSASRTVFLSGSALPVADFRRYLETIDQLPGSCAVRTWAVFVDRSAQRGFDLVAAIQSVIPETTAVLGNGSFVLDTSAADIAMSLAVIADGSSVEVLQRPHVRLEHGVQSVIESIQEVPVPQTTASQGISQTSINYRKVGLQLSVTPHFLGNNHVRLAVKQTNGLIGQTVRIDGNEVPVIQSQTVDTQTTLAVGQTVILGGVATRRETSEKGLLRNVKRVSEGYLYVILSTSFDIPKALPVGSQAVVSPYDGVPLSDPDPAHDGWIMGELLPPRDPLPLPAK